MVQVVLLLALAVSPLPKETDPAALLARAGIHEVDLNQCSTALRVYKRFFEVCAECELKTYGRQRFDVAISRCSVPKKSIAAYDTGEDANPADATQVEVLGMIPSVAAIDPGAAAELMATTLELGVIAETRTYNELRMRAFEIFMKDTPTQAQVDALLNRVEKVDPAHAHALRTRRPGLDSARKQAIALLRERSTTDGEASPSPLHRQPQLQLDSACKIDLQASPGFVTINSKPWGKVYINGKLVGETPISRHKVAAGCAEVRVVNERTGIERSESITVHPNKVTIYQFRLDGAD